MKIIFVVLLLLACGEAEKLKDKETDENIKKFTGIVEEIRSLFQEGAADI